jgi:succinate dehydrogenase / fumarate reductase flavoprotein subunit
MANPCYTQIHPTCIPVSGDHQSKLTLMSESLRNDGRVWVPKSKADVGKHPGQIAEADRDYYLERKYPSYGNLAPRDIASRAAKEACDDGRGVGPGGRGVYLDFGAAIQKQGVDRIKEKYGNLFEMYERITDEDAYHQPMRIYPAVHYTMGGLWVNYELMSNLDGLFVAGEANFSDHGANRLGASALMQGLADGYFVLPYTLTNWLAGQKPGVLPQDHPEVRRTEAEATEKIKKLLAIKGKKTAMEFHRESGKALWDDVGMARSRESIKHAIDRIQQLRAEFWENVNVPGSADDLNTALERANRVADYLEFGELLARDALAREESCGGHFRVEYQTPDGEAKRNDAEFAHVAAWEYAGPGKDPVRNTEPLVFENVKLAERSYK